MMNWNDIEVEQKIAQERYQEIIQARQLARSQPGQVKRQMNLGAWLTNLVEKWRLLFQPSPQCCPQ